MMNAGDFYKKGDRVKLTKIGVDHYIGGADNKRFKPIEKGEIVARQHGSLIKVKPDNRKTAQYYHPSFWTLE